MSAIDPSKFYNKEILSKNAIRSAKLRNHASWVKEHRKMPSHILGPPDVWMEFEKQANALATASKESTDVDALCTFVYQRDNGYRKFVVAHPEVYWWHYEHRPPEQRCSYEVIPENQPCRLYLDLEYSIESNPESNGSAMTDTMIDVVCAYLLRCYGLPCNKYDALNLDSTTVEKFSRHVIFNVRNVAFQDNYHVGRFVKSICEDLSEYTATKESEHDVLSSFDRTKLEQLFVKTRKGNGLFVDCSVYTKNRHFRIYKSTKWGKRSNLEISTDCRYVPSNLRKDRDFCTFVDSLVSYFATKSNLTLLKYTKIGTAEATRFAARSPEFLTQERIERCSKYPVLDEYVRNKIHPGKIRACKYFDFAELLVYETTGYRYCENIGGCHKRNNVILIVSLKNKTMYQKCHDEDCSGFKSDPKKLPEEVCFRIDDGDDTLLSCMAMEDA